MPTPTDTARSFARARPATLLPCPVCAVSLRAANLDAHLARVHPLATDAPAPWRATDRRVVRTSLVALAVVVVGALVFAAARTVAPGSPAAYALAAVVAAAALFALAAAAGMMRATLSIEGDALVLRHSLGLGRRVAVLPAPLSMGSLVGARRDVAASADATAPAPTEVRAGWYLRVGEVTVGCRRSTSFNVHWDAARWRTGERRVICDAVVTPAVMVALEYALAARGMLAPLPR